VNKVATKVELRFSILRSGVLDDGQKARLLQKLAPRLTRSGDLVIQASIHRERRRNEEEARARLARILGGALATVKPRVKTHPSASSRRRRLESKRRKGLRKHERRSVEEE